MAVPAGRMGRLILVRSAAVGDGSAGGLVVYARVSSRDQRAEDHDAETIILALHRYPGRTPSKLLALSLADTVGDLRTQNQPGTTDEYPNRRVPLRGRPEEKCSSKTCSPTRGVATLAEAMKQIVHPRV
ncbi:MAG: hypothetical protein NVSMB60_32980 [Mycobacterium sp.]